MAPKRKHKDSIKRHIEPLGMYGVIPSKKNQLISVLLGVFSGHCQKKCVFY
jgi:hypothetical protein